MKIGVTFLGTGSSIPTKSRNHPGILINYGAENILVDCGEGIQRQFRIANINPCKLTRLLITHWHGDHILGIPGLLQTLVHNGYNRKLIVQGPKGTKNFMEILSKLFVMKGRLNLQIEEVKGKFGETRDFFIEAMEMKHDTPTYAYAFTEKDKIRIKKDFLEKKKVPNSPEIKKLLLGKDIKIKDIIVKAKEATYSQKGKKISIVFDTLNNDNSIKIAKNSNLLICESNFSEADKDKAKEYYHLTAKQAATIAKKAKVEILILTHISQRYEGKEKILLAEAKKIFPKTMLSYDLMNIDI